MSLDELKEWLAAEGFRFGENHLRGQHNECGWYAWRRSQHAAAECETNGDKCQIVVQPHKFDHPNYTSESVEVNVCGQADGVWWELKAYSMPPEVAKVKMAKVESSLIAAWNGLHRPAGRSEG